MGNESTRMTITFLAKFALIILYFSMKAFNMPCKTGKTLKILKLAAFPSGGISSLSIVGLAGRWSPSLPGGLERKTLVILKLVGLLLPGMFSPSIRGKAAKSLGSLVEI